MNEKALLHEPDSKYSYPISNDTMVIVLRMDAEEIVDKVELVYESKYVIYLSQKTLLMEEKFRDRLYKYYVIKVKLEDTRLAYVFRIWQDKKAYYYSEDGITETYDFKVGHFNYFQVAYINDNDVHKFVPWMKDRVFYLIFVDRFFRGSQAKDDSYINLKWGSKVNPKSFAGGDLAGIMKKMDYLEELGVNGIYLTPVFKSISNHKYDIIDYKKIDPMFGTNEDFRALVAEAHKRGMKMILDAVFNHCSIYAPEFQDVIKYGRKSRYYDWFLIHGDEVDVQEMNYEVFAFCNYMPKFNTANPEVQQYLIEIAVYWIRKYDIDGWRLDVSDEISHGFWRKFRQAVKEAKSDCVIIGENWHDANVFLRGDQYDSIMNYAFTKSCMDYFATKALDAKGFAWKLSNLLMRNSETVNRMMLNLLDSHDTDRFFSLVHCNKHKLLSAIAVTCLFVGAPCITYGTEIAMEGGYDPDNRRCFDWDETHWDKQFMQIVKQILTLKKIEVVQSGDIELHGSDDLFYLTRKWKEDKIVLITNQSEKEQMLSLEGEVIVQNQYENGLLGTDGFVIIRGK